MRLTLEYNIPDELDIYKAALRAKHSYTGVPMSEKTTLNLTKDEVLLIDALISEAINTCDDYLKDPSNANRPLILDKIKETKSKYVNLTNYINFIAGQKP